METTPVTVVETAAFLRQADAIWTDADRRELVDFIAWHPESGDVIPGTGGVRKLRWTRRGGGKRGGARVIYFYHSAEAPIYLLLAYAKARRDDMTPDETAAVAKLATLLKQQARRA